MLAIAATAIILVPALLLLLRVTKTGISRYAGSSVIVLATIPLVSFFLQFLLAQTTEHGVDVSPNEVPGFEIPMDATKVSYHSKFGPTRLVAQFSITEDKFRKWMESNQRAIQPISHPEVVTEISSADPILENSTVKSGYRWDDYDTTVKSDDSGTTIVFDDANDRVFIRVTLW